MRVTHTPLTLSLMNKTHNCLANALSRLTFNQITTYACSIEDDSDKKSMDFLSEATVVFEGPVLKDTSSYRIIPANGIPHRRVPTLGKILVAPSSASTQ